MQSKLFFYSLIGTLFFASLTETVLAEKKLITIDQGAHPDIQQSVLKFFWMLQFDHLTKRGQTNLFPKMEFQDVTSKAKFRKIYTETKGSQQKGVNKFSNTSKAITMFMCGDVMLGRGIDQVLAHPSDPILYEPYMRSAKGYVELAEKVNGPIPYPVSDSYIWGDAIEELERISPDLRLINLETSITKSNDYWENKGIHYRMHPENIACITAAKIDYCSLANNHILDWGYSGLKETLETLQKGNVKSAGAGHSLLEAGAPAVMKIEGKGRVVVFSYGLVSSGISPSWAALEDRHGVNLLKDLSNKTIKSIKEKVEEVKQQRDIVVVSIHWGDNWGYDIPSEQIEFAHKLIDGNGVDVIHGHSSHHVKGLEVYKDKLIIYGCGDFINDYEGIGGYEYFRGDLGLMYFVSVDPSTGKLVQLQMVPTQIKHFKVNRPSRAGALWLKDVLNREGKKYGTRVKLNKDYILTLQWD
jgi:poly-gamma-glutamate capsule biosynthesis protein CapA/YwtB (metallophosphatase superfamily)